MKVSKKGEQKFKIEAFCDGQKNLQKSSAESYISFSEKSTKSWCNLPQGFDFT